MSRRTALKVVGCVVGVALLVVVLGTCLVAAGFLDGPPSEASVAKFKEQGQLILDAIEKHRSTSGRCPASLSEVVSNYSTRYGPWKYDVAKDGMTFSLHVGEYMKHEFELWWYGADWGWRLDH